METHVYAPMVDRLEAGQAAKPRRRRRCRKPHHDVPEYGCTRWAHGDDHHTYARPGAIAPRWPDNDLNLTDDDLEH